MSVVINLSAVLIAAISGVIVGFLWYGPLFGKMWLYLVDKTPQEMKKVKVIRRYIIMFFSMLLMAFVFAQILFLALAHTPFDGFKVGLLIWFGFVIPTGLANVLWTGKSKVLYMLDMGYYLVVLSVMGIVLTAWK